MSSSKTLLRRLSKSVYYLAGPKPASTSQTPPRDRKDVDDDEPRLLIMFGWMDAQLKHVEKYVTSYRKLFPTSSILVLQSSQKGFYSNDNMNETKKAFEPALEIITKEQQQQLELEPEGGGRRMLVHVFSNGGCMSLKWLNQELLARRRRRETEPTSSNRPRQEEEEKLPLLSSSSPPLEGTRAIIFDSCPGKSSLLVTMRAFSAPIRSKWLKLPTMGLLAVLHGFISLYNLIVRKPPILNRLYSYLNEPTSLPRVPRLYLYSKIDELIPYKDVEAHAKQARERPAGGGGGIRVDMEEFQGTSHVGHMRGDPERYWKAIEKIWRESK